MKKFNLFLFILCLIEINVMPSLAFSIIPNVRAQNLARYYANNRRYNPAQQRIPYVYSEQQARYYGLYNVPQSQFREYGITRDNTTSTPAIGNYGYYGN